MFSLNNLFDELTLIALFLTIVLLVFAFIILKECLVRYINIRLYNEWLRLEEEKIKKNK